MKTTTMLKSMVTAAALYFGFATASRAATIYIDPQYTGTEAGTTTQPYNSWADLKWQAGNTYLFKRGSSIQTTGIFRPTVNNITIGAYGTGERPRFISSTSGRIFDLGALQNVVVQDIEIISTNNAESCIHFFNSVRGSVINSKVSGSQWGIRIVNSKGKFRLINTEVFKIGDDGVFVSNVDSIEVDGSSIHDVNQKWFTNKSETYSGGDCLQTVSVRYFRVANSRLDHSRTGNKFCFISSSTISGIVPTGILENNVFTREPFNDGGDVMYLVNGADVIVRNNLIQNGTIGIWNYNKNTRIYYNVFEGQTTSSIYGFAASGSQLRVYNNIFANSTSVCFLRYETGTFRNNIFHKISGNVFAGNLKPVSENNCFSQSTKLGTLTSIGTNSMIKDPLFVNEASLNFRLQSASPCLHKGQAIKDGTIPYPVKDYYGNSITSTCCIGIHESSGTATPTPTPVTNKLPTVSLTSPSNGANFKAPATINLSATAADSDGNIAKVEFYHGTTKIGEKTTAPYTYTWTNVAFGKYEIWAVATDNSNARVQTSAVTVYVNEAVVVVTNKAPEVRITSPVTGYTASSPASVTITASASDADGTISKVEFYLGSTKIGEKTSAPYSLPYTFYYPTTYNLTVVATDNSGNKTTSPIVKMYVNTQKSATLKTDVESGEATEVKIYPNPTLDGLFWMELNNIPENQIKITITDLTGKLVYSETDYMKETKKEFNMPELKNGIYIMTVTDNMNLNVSEKIIKK